MRLAAPTPDIGADTLAVAARRHPPLAGQWLLIESVSRYVETARRRLAAEQVSTDGKAAP